ncbi:hypothetical protein FRC00_004991, partial [Tulasnella sp. 408]
MCGKCRYVRPIDYDETDVGYEKTSISFDQLTDVDSDSEETDVDGSVYLEDEDQNSASDLEYDSDENAPPKRKKMKTTKANVFPQSLKKDVFSTITLNVMYEFFGHLHPLDLLHLARTSKLLRSCLMSKRSINVWKKAREAVLPRVPECPKDRNEPQWTVFLFTRQCSVCATPRIYQVEWSLHLRDCGKCFEKNLLSSQNAASAYPDIGDLDTVLELLPYTITRKSFARRVSCPGGKTYYSADIKRMAEVVKHHKLRIDAGVPGARDEFNTFMERRKVEAAEQVESAAKLKERIQEMQDQLIKNEQQPWERIRSKAEMKVGQQKEIRLQKERQAVQAERRTALESRYATFKMTYDASPDNQMPTVDASIHLRIVKEVIEMHGDDVSESMFDDVFNKLLPFFHQWRKEKRVEFAKLIIKAQSASGSVDRDPIAAENDGILLLATSIFLSCESGKRRGESVHWIGTIKEKFPTCKYHSSYTAQKSMGSIKSQMGCIGSGRRAIEQAKSLVCAAGLDPATSTQKDMDERDARFWCLDCSKKKWDGQVARNWRNCMRHFVRQGIGKRRKVYAILSSDDRTLIHLQEEAVSSLQDVDWNTVAITLKGV